MIMTSQLEELVRQAISNGKYRISINIDKGKTLEVFNYIGWRLSNHGMIHWRIDDDNDNLVVGFRPFNYELDTSLLATLHH